MNIPRSFLNIFEDIAPQDIFESKIKTTISSDASNKTYNQVNSKPVFTLPNGAYDFIKLSEMYIMLPISALATGTTNLITGITGAVTDTHTINPFLGAFIKEIVVMINKKVIVQKSESEFIQRVMAINEIDASISTLSSSILPFDSDDIRPTDAGTAIGVVASIRNKAIKKFMMITTPLYVKIYLKDICPMFALDELIKIPSTLFQIQINLADVSGQRIATYTAAQAALTYTIEDPKIHMNIYRLKSTAQEKYISTFIKHPLKFTYPDITIQRDILKALTTNQITFKAVSNVSKMYIMFPIYKLTGKTGGGTTLANNVYNPFYTSYIDQGAASLVGAVNTYTAPSKFITRLSVRYGSQTYNFNDEQLLNPRISNASLIYDELHRLLPSEQKPIYTYDNFVNQNVIYCIDLVPRDIDENDYAINSSEQVQITIDTDSQLPADISYVVALQYGRMFEINSKGDFTDISMNQTV